VNYFLQYDNNRPLFIGGTAHGKKLCVALDREHWCVPVRHPFHPRVKFIPSDAVQELTIHVYRRERFQSHDTTFHVMIHEALDARAALMLLFQDCANGPDKDALIAQLRADNANLKFLLQQAMSL
jgi:hypothetical protein